MKRLISFSAPVFLLLAAPVACDDDESGTDDGAMDSGSGGTDEDDGEDDGEDDADADDEGGDVDNEAACESLLDALECGGADLSQSVPCDQYANLACDLADYFECLEDNFTCNDGVFDPTAWMMCVDLASCD